MRENTNIEATFAAQVLLCCDTSGFYRLCADPAALYCLEAEVTVDNPVTARCVPFYFASLGFSVLDPLGHLCH